jgi:hypothetical protein
VAQQFDRVREVADEAVSVANDVTAAFARAHRFLELNADVNVPWASLAGKVFTAANGTETMTSTAHGMANGTRVRVEASGGGVLPTGLSAGTNYYVVATAANTFQLSATLGGAAVNITTDGTGTLTAYPLPDYLLIETNGNLNGRTYDPLQVSNAIGSLAQFRNYMTNAAVTQGDHLGNLNQLAAARG